MSRRENPVPKRLGTTAADVFERLVEAIFRGQFPAGTPLREAALAREWNVSRTPLREAVRRAAEAGFLVLRPNQAPLVRRLTADDIHDLYDLRELLELHALRLAWPRLEPAVLLRLEQLARAAEPANADRRRLNFDMALHRLWMDRCGNSWLSADLDWLYQFLRIIQHLMSADRAALQHAYDEHRAILDALLAGNPKAAARHLRHHIRHAGAAVTKTITNP